MHLSALIMVDSFLNLPMVLQCLLLVGAGSLMAVLGLLLVRRLVPRAILHGDEAEESGAILSLVGTLFAVLLAFIVVVVWQDYQDARRKLVLEAAALGNLYRDARGLDGGTEAQIQGLIRQYTQELVEESWPAMATGEPSTRAWTTFNTLYTLVVHHDPANAREEIVLEKLIGHLNDLASHRRIRLLNSRASGPPRPLWLIIFMGNGILILFSYFFRISSRRVQGLMTALMGAMLALVIFLILLFSHPYQGSNRLSPQPLERLLEDVYPIADAGVP